MTEKEIKQFNIKKIESDGELSKPSGGRTTTYKKKDWNRDVPKQYFEKEILQTRRVTKVTRGGRQFSNTALLLFKDPENKSVSFIYSKGKEMGVILRKSFFRAKKKMVSFFPEEPRTISRALSVKYKSTKIIIKPTPEGTGIKAGGVLNLFFYYLNIKDVSAKIIGSRNKLNVMRAAFIAISNLTNKRYVF